MTDYTFIDADAHVEECEATWSYLGTDFSHKIQVKSSPIAHRTYCRR